jgi:hypothetical protein
VSLRKRSTTLVGVGTALAVAAMAPAPGLARSHAGHGRHAHRAQAGADPFYSTSCGPWTAANASLSAIAQELGRTPAQVAQAVRADKLAIAALRLAPPAVGEPAPGDENPAVVFTRPDLPGLAAFATSLNIDSAHAQGALVRYICGPYPG